jgi:hypothetical protein
MLLLFHRPTEGGMLFIALNTFSIGNFNSYDLCLSLRKVKNLILEGKFIRLKMLAMLCGVSIAAYGKACCCAGIHCPTCPTFSPIKLLKFKLRTKVEKKSVSRNHC